MLNNEYRVGGNMRGWSGGKPLGGFFPEKAAVVHKRAGLAIK